MDKITNIETGLSSAEAAVQLKSSGLNTIAAKNNSRLKKIFKYLTSPISLMFLVAAALSYADGKIFDFYFILILMFINFFISFWQERKADNAIEQLNKLLKLSVKVLRDSLWQQLDSEQLVPGDIVQVYIGDVIPADLKIINGNNFSVNEAALTGESLPVDKKNGDLLYSGAFVVTGQALAQVETTGSGTYFGKILASLDKKPKRSILEKDILTISKFLSLLSVAAVLILTIIFLINKLPLLETLTLDISLVIAGIPIALPTVLTLIISLGVLKLSKDKVVVRRLASLEDLANVNLLFTDKTGTLTKNEISIDKIMAYSGSETEVLLYAYLASISNDHDLINQTIIKKAEAAGLKPGAYQIKEFIPADSDRKRSSALIANGEEKIYISVGAPQVVASFCRLESAAAANFDKDVEQAAADGYRVLAVAINQEAPIEKDMKLIGLLFLSDELRPDAKETLKFLKDNGVTVKMLTGDHRAIAYRIGKELELEPANIYYEILPADKYKLVLEGKSGHVVAVTGDGVNDLPAVKTADVGFAVSNAVSALKSSADIVLLSSGISVIMTAIIEARKIFARINSYAIYRISESFRLIITIFILGLIYHTYPMTPVQLILLAILNDIPIVSLAFNRVKIASQPSKIEVKKRFTISLLYGFIGVFNSMLFLLIMIKIFHYDWSIISTAFFLKLIVSGHLLVFVAHTKEKWYKFLPSKEVILAIIITQVVAVCLSLFGIFMNKIPGLLVIIVWIWAIFWMQVSDYTKSLYNNH